MAIFDRLEVNASWLLRLRWVAVIGQLVTIAVARLVIDVQLATLPLCLVVGFTALSNIAFTYWLQTHTRLPESIRVRRDPWVLTALMGVDLLSLTMLLFLSGGPANPFILFFSVPTVIFVPLSLNCFSDGVGVSHCEFCSLIKSAVSICIACFSNSCEPYFSPSCDLICAICALDTFSIFGISVDPSL